MATEGGISFSPPFITSCAVGPSGVVAVGTADGKLGVFFGGERTPTGKKTKHWKGLDTQEMLLLKVMEGPIVAMCVFISLAIHSERVEAKI